MPPRGDEGELFQRYHDRLRRVTAYQVSTSRENIEEACAFAWAQLLTHDVQRETAFAWLAKVASREAVRLSQVDLGAVPLGHEPGAVSPELVAAPGGNPDVTPERWGEALSRLRRLPERDRRAVAMRAFGWKYAEIADALGMSHTRVTQILARADAHLRELEERQTPPRSVRVARLRHLEDDPPRWLRDAIGRRPRVNRKQGNNSLLIREWRRLALALDDYRTDHGVHDARRALGPRPNGRDQRVQHDELRLRIDEFTTERARHNR